MTLDGHLSAEGAGVAGVLGDFHLLNLLTERGTVTVDFVLAPCPGPDLIYIDCAFGSMVLKAVEEGGGVFIPGTVFTGDADLCKIC